MPPPLLGSKKQTQTCYRRVLLRQVKIISQKCVYKLNQADNHKTSVLHDGTPRDGTESQCHGQLAHPTKAEPATEHSCLETRLSVNTLLVGYKSIVFSFGYFCTPEKVEIFLQLHNWIFDKWGKWWLAPFFIFSLNQMNPTNLAVLYMVLKDAEHLN